MLCIERSTAIEYLKKRDLFRYAEDIHMMTVGSFKAYSLDRDLTNPNSLLVIQSMGKNRHDKHVKIYADNPAIVNDYLQVFDSEPNCRYHLQEAWLHDAYCQIPLLKPTNVSYQYTVEGGLNNTNTIGAAILLDEVNIPVVEEYDHIYHYHMPINFPGRISVILKQQLSGSNVRIYGRILSGVLVSYVVIEAMKLGDGDNNNVWSVGPFETVRSHRRCGYGKDALYVASKWLLDNGKKIYYDCASDNIASQKTCESLGYKLICKKWQCVKNNFDSQDIAPDLTSPIRDGCM